jgi:PAS domain S-box-containing protein
MNDIHDTDLQLRLKSIGLAFCFIVAGIGLAGITGWTFDIEVLKRPFPRLPSINPVSALLFILISLSLFHYCKTTSARMMLPVGVFSMLIGILKLAEVLLDIRTEVDQLLLFKKLKTGNEPGHMYLMAPSAAFNFLMTGLALVAFKFKSDRALYQPLALIVLLISLFSIVGYLYKVEVFYSVFSYIPMAVHTAVGFLLLSVAMLFYKPDVGIMHVFTLRLTGSIVARRLIPAAFVVPIVLGYLRLTAHVHGLVTVEFGITLLVLSITLFYLYLIWFNSDLINRKDELRTIVENKLSESNKTLADQTAKLTQLFESSPDALITLDMQLVVNSWNKAAERMYGFSSAEMIGKAIEEVIPTVYVQENRDKVLSLFMEKGSWQGEFVQFDRSGRKLYVLCSASFVYDAKGNATGIIVINRDISERKASEEKIKDLNDHLGEVNAQLRQSNEELDSFSYSVSHDLRAPLRAILGYSRMIEEDYSKLFDDEGRRLFSVVQKNARRMGMLIDDLLAFSHLGKTEIKKTEVMMKSIVETAVQEVLNGAHVTINIGELHSAYADPGLIKQVFINLLSNAIKYSSKKQHPQVDISSERNDGEVIFSVKDNGDGFDMQYAHKLFGVFQRLHKASEFEGTGVGLAIVHRIISRHNGRIWAESTKGQGATFYFSLPHHK